MEPTADMSERYALLAERTARAVWAACVADVRILRPGHVNVRAPAGGVSADDLQRAARRVAPALVAPAAGVGTRLLAAVGASRTNLPVNANLGILLLATPLVHAVLSDLPGETLRERLRAVLGALDREDARLMGEALALVSPGVEPFWLRVLTQRPGGTLRQKMDAVAAEDRIAYQYTHDYIDIFAFALPRLRQARARWGRSEWPLISVFLGMLARFPDSHIQRLYGEQAARAVMSAAAHLDTAVWRAAGPQRFAIRVRDFDTQLRGEGLHPSTTADLAVATLLALRLQSWVGRPGVPRPRESTVLRPDFGGRRI
jgi:triphosphoribosyl-dephospho-CoA synthase